MTVSDPQTWTLAIAAAAVAVAVLGQFLAWSIIRRQDAFIDWQLKRQFMAGRQEEAREAALWREAVSEGARQLSELDDREILLRVLRDLRGQMDAIAEIGEPILGSAELARNFRQAWRDHAAKGLNDAIQEIETDWDRLEPHMALAGLTGPSLRFKAETVTAFLAPARLTPASVADGPPGLIERITEVVRSGKLLTYLKGADVVWESAVAALAVAAPVAAGLPPAAPQAAGDLGKHSVTEVKKMVEAILDRLRLK